MITQARQDSGHTHEPQAQARRETTVEVMIGRRLCRPARLAGAPFCFRCLSLPGAD